MDATGFSVTPKRDCPHVATSFNEGLLYNADIKKAIFEKPCQYEGCDATENWLCLSCFKVHCSRYANSHAMKHYEEHSGAEHPIPHCIGISFADLSFWCYECESYIEHEDLSLIFSLVHTAKFGEPPGSTRIVVKGSNTDPISDLTDGLGTIAPTEPLTGKTASSTTTTTSTQEKHIDDEINVFVYGTLRRGGKWHHLLWTQRTHDATQLLAAQSWIEGPYRLVDTAYDCPALVNAVSQKNVRILGELYRVNAKTLKILDELEGYSEDKAGGINNLYNRVTVKVMTDQGGTGIDAFTYTSASFSPLAREVAANDWRWHRFLIGNAGHKERPRTNRKKGAGGGKGEKESVASSVSFDYFAYGSCMDDGRLKEAGVAQFFQLVGVRQLHGYRLAFSRLAKDGGRADLVEDPRSVVEGVLYSVSVEALDYLIEREGAPNIYRPVFIEVTPRNNTNKHNNNNNHNKGKEAREALSFVVRDKIVGKEYAPPPHYAEEILRGAEAKGLTPEYRDRLRQHMERLGSRGGGKGRGGNSKEKKNKKRGKG